MEESVPVMARCPECGYEWLQDGYTRHTLPSLLWPISTEERQALNEELSP
jgi:hypothetical protein